MGYMEMLGAFKGPGLGKGPMPEGEQEQGGMAGFARAAGVGMKGAGAGLIAQSQPRLAAGLQAQDRAQYGAYADMLHGQQEQDRRAKRHTDAMSILGGLAAKSQLFKGRDKAGIDIPQPGQPTGDEGGYI